jgi:hypothetical protein
MARAEPVAQAEAAATLAPPPREINIFRDVLQAREASPEPPTTRIASLPSAAGARPWLQLGIALAGSHSKLGLRAFINWVRRCIVQEDYRELFASRGSDDVPADLFAVARACREEYRAELANWFRDWSKPVPDWGEEAVHPAIARLGALLSRAVLVGESRSLAPLLDDERWLVVLVDPGTDDKRLGRDDLTKRLLKQLASSATKRRGVKTVLFRMGDVDPAAVDGDAAMTFVATPRELPLSPRLVAPILGRFKRDAVAAMLWISDELPLDAEDLVDDWKRFTLVFTPGQRQIPVDSPWKVEAGPSADAETTAKNWGKRTDRFVQGLDHA